MFLFLTLSHLARAIALARSERSFAVYLAWSALAPLRPISETVIGFLSFIHLSVQQGGPFDNAWRYAILTGSRDYKS